MSTAVRVLLHQSRTSLSLLQQLGLRSGRYFSVAPPINPRNLLSECNLVIMQIGPEGAGYLPQLDSTLIGKKQRPFPEWWSGPVAKAQNKQTMSRMDIVVAVAGMDGGAHVDPALTPLYERFRSGVFLGWMVMLDGVDGKFLQCPQYACIRAIAHELLLTLGKYAPWSFRKPYEPISVRQST
ncbi:MAG: hypothetical protein WBJ19_15525 [Rhodoferax sp.]